MSNSMAWSLGQIKADGLSKAIALSDAIVGTSETISTAEGIDQANSYIVNQMILAKGDLIFECPRELPTYQKVHYASPTDLDFLGTVGEYKAAGSRSSIDLTEYYGKHLNVEILATVYVYIPKLVVADVDYTSTQLISIASPQYYSWKLINIDSGTIYVCFIGLDNYVRMSKLTTAQYTTLTAETGITTVVRDLLINNITTDKPVFRYYKIYHYPKVYSGFTGTGTLMGLASFADYRRVEVTVNHDARSTYTSFTHSRATYSFDLSGYNNGEDSLFKMNSTEVGTTTQTGAYGDEATIKLTGNKFKFVGIGQKYANGNASSNRPKLISIRGYK